MKSLYFFGYYLNGLEFVTYILIPTAIVLMILLYIGSNYKLLELSFASDNNDLNNFTNTYDFKEAGVKIKIGKIKKKNKKSIIF